MSTSLNKEFSERDIQRMRNIITGNTSNNTRIQTGYTSNTLKRTEGDIWEENGKTWTILNGIKQTVTKHDSLKAMVEFPLICPNCKKPMKNHPLNKKMYSIHSKCLDCVVEYETKLRIEGKYEEYEKNLLNQNKNTSVDDFEQQFEEFLKTQNNSFITEDGDIEQWSGNNIDPKIIKLIKENIKTLRETEI
jgi:hypothetical protein